LVFEDIKMQFRPHQSKEHTRV